jgi:hypothetical protein
MLGKPAAGGTDYLGVAYLLLVLAVAFLPVLLRRPAPPTDQSDSGPDDGPGPPRPPIRPNPPPGGIPLPDAAPARARLRDHERLADGLSRRPRRPATGPSRKRVRSSSLHSSRPPRTAGLGEHR